MEVNRMLKISNLYPHQKIIVLTMYLLRMVCERKHKDAGSISRYFIKEVETHTSFTLHKMFTVLNGY